MKWTVFYDPHSMGKGTKTGTLVEELCTDLQKRGKYQNRVRCRPTLYFGERSRATRLSYVDIVVADEVTKKARVLCEIEEYGANPKKIIGDTVNVFFADGITLKGEPYMLDKPYFILGIFAGREFKEKAHDIINRVKKEIPQLSSKVIIEEPIGDIETTKNEIVKCIT